MDLNEFEELMMSLIGMVVYFLLIFCLFVCVGYDLMSPLIVIQLCWDGPTASRVLTSTTGSLGCLPQGQ